MGSSYVILYFISSIFFILGIKMLSSPITARRGNLISFSGMSIAIITTHTYEEYNLNSIIYIISGISLGGIIGLIFAKKVQMTSMPQMVAIFNGLGGLASSLIAFSEIIKVSNSLEFNIVSISILISVLIGSVTIFRQYYRIPKITINHHRKTHTYTIKKLSKLIIIIIYYWFNGYFILLFWRYFILLHSNKCLFIAGNFYCFANWRS